MGWDSLGCFKTFEKTNTLIVFGYLPFILGVNMLFDFVSIL